MPKGKGDESLCPGTYFIALDRKESCKGNPEIVAAFRLINQLLEEGVPVNWTRRNSRRKAGAILPALF